MAEGIPSGQTGKSGLPVPYPLAIVICDAIYRCPATGKVSLLGCYSAIVAKEFPVTHQGMAIHITLTDGHGQIPIKIRLIDAAESRDPVFELDGQIVFSDPRMVADLDLRAGPIVFVAPGEYRLQLFARGEHVIERRIVVIGAEAENQKEEP